MRLEYVYEKNNNIKYQIKCFGPLLLAFFVYFSIKNQFEFAIKIVFKFLLIFIVYVSFCLIYNNYRKKELHKIIEHGEHVRGTITDIDIPPRGGDISLKRAIKYFGENGFAKLEVRVKDKKYRIDDIYYNEALMKLQGNFRNIPTCVDLYMLGDEVVADLESIRID